jgi:hypothetical protein
MNLVECNTHRDAESIPLSIVRIGHRKKKLCNPFYTAKNVVRVIFTAINHQNQKARMRSYAIFALCIILCIAIPRIVELANGGLGNRKMAAIYISHKTPDVDRVKALKGFFWERQYWKSDLAYAKYWSEVVERKLVHESTHRFAVPTAVFHFRCSDVPFNGHTAYRMPSVEFLQFVRQKLIEHRIKLCIVTTCWTWPAWPKVSYKHTVRIKRECPTYSTALAQHLKSDSHYQTVTRLCLTNNATQRLFHMADVLISHGSTFSMIPGLAKGKRFISDYPGSLTEGADKTSLSQAVHWTMFDGPMVDSARFADATFDYCSYLDGCKQSQNAHH